MNTPTTVQSTDQVGDTYDSTRWGVYTRRIGTTNWYGRDNYKTLEEARAAVRQLKHNSPVSSVGGITIRFVSDRRTGYEFKLVKVERKSIVLDVGPFSQ